MNKQFDLFVKMKIKELSENISRMTYAYINPDTNEPTVVPAKHYKDILDQPVEVMVNDAVKKQFLSIMFKQMKALKEEEPVLFNETLLLMDIGKTPDALSLNEEAAIKMTAQNLVEDEKTMKKSFHLLDADILSKYEDTKDNSALMASLFSDNQNRNIYEVDFKDPENSKVRKRKDDMER